MKYVGSVEESEKNIIGDLFEKKTALKNLLKIVDEIKAPSLFLNIKAEYDSTSQDFSQWWSEASCKYNWEKTENGFWSIDFETCDIYLYEQ